jgi:hypothetical protein
MSDNNQALSATDAILGITDTKVAEVASELTKLDELKQSRVAIQAKLDQLQADERAALDGAMAESDAITALTNIHALKAVYAAKLTDAAAQSHRKNMLYW